MEVETIQKNLKLFLNENDAEKVNQTWDEKSKEFREFWNERILNDKVTEISEVEIDQIVRTLDRNAKGNTKGSEAVAKAMIPQGVWRRMFSEIKRTKELQKALTKILTEKDDEEVIKAIDHLYKINLGKKNSLTGKSANAINIMLFAYNPARYLSVISLNDRKKIIDYFGFESGPDFEADSPWKRVVLSNKAILKGFQKFGLQQTSRILSTFLYIPVMRQEWKSDSEEESYSSTESEGQEEKVSLSQEEFYMEKELENFLIKNWDKTELGKKYDLIEEDGNLVSQQYLTDIGKIDILVKDKKTNQYVVIELKRSQTSDDTIGQLLRYMGWLEEKKTNGKPTKGIIIAGSYDKKLVYALKKIKDVEIYQYQIDFKLTEFKEK